ncbi:unnamed protein product [Bursaphelenchus xylophilus]|uniref:(pine wood nematode) hypothetical protein n=1 Tax=Bursaphelenchus xylophilus TaxID=6326 RepID=A0A1I7RTQ1_BURXY|nr:unnamed protein product [Bursaphelenchus xylophilus]CAG9122228.1 unnamed protein product [Bursaphelenchus xylophilus]
MYEAYAAEEVVTKLPLDATSLVSCDKHDKLFVGSKQGHLLSINQSSNDKRNYEYQLTRGFEKKAIQELAVVQQLDLVISLTDGSLSVHELVEPFKNIVVFNKYKPISSFGCYLEQENNRLFILICAKKRLYLFKWLLDEFDEVLLTFNPQYLPDIVTKITWIGGHSALFACKNEYQICRIMETDSETNDVGVVRSLSLAPESPFIVRLNEKTAGLLNDNLVTFVDENGNPSLDNCRFSESLVALAYDAPYLVGLSAKGIVEIRSVQPSMLIQKLTFSQPKLIVSCQKHGILYIASDKSVSRLNSRPISKANVDFLVNEKHYDLAVALAENTDGFDKKKLIEIKRQMALNLFDQRKFAESFEIHSEIDTDVLLVIHYLPLMIPDKFLSKLSDYKNDLRLFEPNGNMAENERKQAIIALGDYLSMKRTEIARKLDSHAKSRDFKLSSKEVRKAKETLELVDTVLLKCYIKTRPMLISSLLRISDNSCDFEEAEKNLLERNRTSELFLLYKAKEKHRQALELLKKEATNEDSDLFGLEESVEYLQNLKKEDIDIVFEFAKWILHQDSEMGLKIFCPEQPENQDKWDPEKVLVFLREEKIDAIIPYLEFLIERCGEKRPKFHETLLEHYIIKVKWLMKDYVYTLADNESVTRAGLEDGDLGRIRKKLLDFLTTSYSYSAQKALLLLDNHLIEEKAIVFGRLKRHEEALVLYTNVLMDFKAAENHCLRYFEPRDSVNSKVFFTLYKIYTRPDLVELANLSPDITKKIKPNVNEALKLLRNQADKMDTVSAIKLIPRDASLKKVWSALEAIIEATKNRASHLAILSAISTLAKTKSQAQLKGIQSKRIDIDFNVECSLCNKKIGTTAFVRFPQTGAIVHFFCHRRNESTAELETAMSSSPSFTTTFLKKPPKQST